MKQKTLLERIRRLEEAVKQLQEQLGVPVTRDFDESGGGEGPPDQPPKIPPPPPPPGP